MDPLQCADPLQPVEWSSFLFSSWLVYILNIHVNTAGILHRYANSKLDEFVEIIEETDYVF